MNNRKSGDDIMDAVERMTSQAHTFDRERAGMRIAIGRSFTTIVAAELVGASAGLGLMIFGAREFMKMDTVLVGIVILGLLGLDADVIFRLAARHLGSAYLSEREG